MCIFNLENTSMKISVVTTFHQAGLKQYGQRMIDTFCSNWPKEITLHLYPEGCNPRVPDHSQITLTDLESVKELAAFKQRWKDIPKANGDVTNDPIRSKRKDSGKGFKWNAVRFAHKVYAIFDCARTTDADILFWMDADTVCHSPITLDVVKRLAPENIDLGYLGREGKYSECGLYSMNLRSEMMQNFLREFQRLYDQAEGGIFLLDEWHDSFVFDAVRKKFPYLKQLNWSEGIIRGEGHPLINSEWGAYLDHLKGDRKDLGRSKVDDLKVKRLESYWT
jgi:hypothetical protein